MTVLRGLFGREARANPFENPAVPLSSAALLDWLGGARGPAGVVVTPQTSLNMSAVWRAIALTSNVPASLPLLAYKSGTFDVASSPLLANPHPEMTRLELWRLTYTHRGMWGNAYLQKVRDSVGRVRELWPVSPTRVQVGRVKPAPGNPGGKVFTVVDEWGERHVLSSYDILHIPHLGYDGITGCSPIRAAQAGIGLALAAEEYGARLFGSGSLMAGVLQTEQRLEQGQAEALKQRWMERISGLAKAHEIAVLDSGAKFQPVSHSNTDTQFIESRTFQVKEIARYFGIPPFLLEDTEKSTSWGTGLEQQATGWVVFDLGPSWLAPTEQRISKELLPSTVEASYRVEGLMRGDSPARAEFYRAMREIGALSANEIRARESLPPVPGGDTYLQPLNMGPLGAPPSPGPATDPTP